MFLAWSFLPGAAFLIQKAYKMTVKIWIQLREFIISINVKQLHVFYNFIFHCYKYIQCVYCISMQETVKAQKSVLVNPKVFFLVNTHAQFNILFFRFWEIICQTEFSLLIKNTPHRIRLNIIVKRKRLFRIPESRLPYSRNVHIVMR